MVSQGENSDFFHSRKQLEARADRLKSKVRGLTPAQRESWGGTFAALEKDAALEPDDKLSVGLFEDISTILSCTRPMTAAEIKAELVGQGRKGHLRPGVLRSSVHTALSRAVKSERLIAKGEGAKRRYRLPSTRGSKPKQEKPKGLGTE